MSAADIAQCAVMMLNLISGAVCIGVLRRWRRRLAHATAQMTSIAATYHAHMDRCHRG